jgi:hypothetical protein
MSTLAGRTAMAPTTVFGEPFHARVLLIADPAVPAFVGNDEPNVAIFIVEGHDAIARLRNQLVSLTHDGDVRIVVVPQPLQHIAA